MSQATQATEAKTGAKSYEAKAYAASGPQSGLAAATIVTLIDAAIMTAAVGDYRPAERFAGKLKKKSETLTLRLVRTRDILKEMGRKKGKRILVGFALEVQDAVHQALVKYKKKNLDYVVLNTPRTFAADTMDCRVFREGEVVKRFKGATKEAVANWIVAVLET